MHALRLSLCTGSRGKLHLFVQATEMSMTHIRTLLYVTFYYADLVELPVCLGPPTEGLIECLHCIDIECLYYIFFFFVILTIYLSIKSRNCILSGLNNVPEKLCGKISMFETVT